MKVEQIYTNCLAEAAYYIESNGEAAIIDPLRDPSPYLERAEKAGAKIKYIFETHFHADFVSGHIDLAKASGGQIVFGPNAKPDYEAHIAKDEEIFEVGDLQIKLLHTPGHTLESSTYLLIENGKEKAIFTGDTLFIGEVGRPDLAVKSDLSKEDLAGMLYDSLHNKILPLSEDITIYPAHGAGSACGKNISKQTSDTLKNQKQANYALQDMTKEEFVRTVTEGIMPPPQYFAKNAMLNMKGYDEVAEVVAKGTKLLSIEEFEKEKNSGALILDTRDPQVFAQGFIPDSINIGLNGMYAIWVGTLIKDINQKILIVCEEGKEEEAVIRLARVGYDNTVGCLKGGLELWEKQGKEVEKIKSISPKEFEKEFSKQKINILDVRKPSEFEKGHIDSAENFPLDFINDSIESLVRSKKYHIHCAGGYRSMIAASILKKNGFKNLIDIAGGFGKIKETNLPIILNEECSLSQ